MRLLITFLMLISISMNAIVHGEEKKTDKELTKIIISDEHRASDWQRPRLPVKKCNVHCVYNDNGILKIEFDESEGLGIIKVELCGESLTSLMEAHFDTTLPFSYYIGVFYYPVNIRILTDTHEYIGVIEPYTNN